MTVGTPSPHLGGAAESAPAEQQQRSGSSRVDAEPETRPYRMLLLMGSVEASRTGKKRILSLGIGQKYE